MLRAFILDFGGSWDKYLPLIVSSTIGMPPFEALYGRRCRSPICWEEIRDRRILGLELIQETTDKIKIIMKRM